MSKTSNAAKRLPSLISRRRTSTSWPTAARSRERERITAISTFGGDTSEPTAKKKRIGSTRASACQLRARNATATRMAAPPRRPTTSEVFMRLPQSSEGIHEQPSEVLGRERERIRPSPPALQGWQSACQQVTQG